MPGGPEDEPLAARCAEPPPRELVDAVAQFNEGRFFEQHETLETLWRETRAPVRDLYHGIIQVGVGFHHWRRGNFHGAAVLLEEGIRRLEPFGPSCQGVDVAALVDAARGARERLIELGQARMGEYDIAAAPRIRLDRG